MILSMYRPARPALSFALAAIVLLIATFARAEEKASFVDHSGAGLLKAAGMDLPLADIEANIRLQMSDARAGHSQEAIRYAAEPYNATALMANIGADLDSALPEETRRAVSAFFTSPTGANLRVWTNRHHSFLKSAGSDDSKKILSEGTTLVQEQARGRLYQDLHSGSGRRTFDEVLLRATNHAFIAAEGQLDNVEGGAVDAKIKELYPDALLDLVREFDLPSFAYGYRFASEQELTAFQNFVLSKPGADFIEASQKAIDARLREAGDALLKRLKEQKS